jgi:hypothetical protein
MNDRELAPFLHYAGGSKVAFIVVALVCFGIGALGFVDRTAGLGIQLGLAIPFGLIGLWMVFVALRPAGKHPAIVVLRERAADIVWVYPSTQSVNGVPSQTFINFGLVDGSQRALAIGAKNDPKPLLDAARAAIANATFGYSTDLETRFKQSPASLRRA